MVSIDSVEGAEHEYVAKVNQNLKNKNEKKISSRVDRTHDFQINSLTL